MRGREAQDVQFVKSKRTLTPSTDDETSLKGEGRYRGASGRTMPFSYGCAINTKTGATSGVVFRDLAVAEDKPFQPDLTNVSVIDCEGAAVASLKSKHPRAGRIVLDGETRQLRPAADERIALEGRGALGAGAGDERLAVHLPLRGRATQRPHRQHPDRALTRRHRRTDRITSAPASPGRFLF